MAVIDFGSFAPLGPGGYMGQVVPPMTPPPVLTLADQALQAEQERQKKMQAANFARMVDPSIADRERETFYKLAYQNYANAHMSLAGPPGPARMDRGYGGGSGPGPAAAASSSGGGDGGGGGGYAGGTNSATPGWHMVGERGPELARFNGGEQVLSNPQSQAVSKLTNINPQQYYEHALSQETGTDAQDPEQASPVAGAAETAVRGAISQFTTPPPWTPPEGYDPNAYGGVHRTVNDWALLPTDYGQGAQQAAAAQAATAAATPPAPAGPGNSVFPLEQLNFGLLLQALTSANSGFYQVQGPDGKPLGPPLPTVAYRNQYIDRMGIDPLTGEQSLNAKTQEEQRTQRAAAQYGRLVPMNNLGHRDGGVGLGPLRNYISLAATDPEVRQRWDAFEDTTLAKSQYASQLSRGEMPGVNATPEEWALYYGRQHLNSQLGLPLNQPTPRTTQPAPAQPNTAAPAPDSGLFNPNQYTGPAPANGYLPYNPSMLGNGFGT